MVGFIQDRTLWVLFLASNGNPEDRHVQDISFGLFCLESAGIDKDDIRIYIDGQDRHSISQLVSLGSTNGYMVAESADFFDQLKANTHANLVMFVTGHGSINGITGPAPIQPFELINSIKSAPDLRRAVVYLGQCYAGIFNYIGAGNRVSPGASGADVILMGATSLHESISSSTTETLAAGQVQWIANIFLLHVFKWISSPIDVDGDGKNTVMDSFKYAGAASNMQNKQIKIQSFARSVDLHAQYVSAKSDSDASPSDVALRLKLQAVERQYADELAIRYTHQECWVLNAIPAQTWEI